MSENLEEEKMALVEKFKKEVPTFENANFEVEKKLVISSMRKTFPVDFFDKKLALRA